MSKSKLEYKLTAAIPPANGTDAYFFRWRLRSVHNENGSVDYEYRNEGPIIPTQGATVVETQPYTIDPPEFDGKVSVGNYVVDLAPYNTTFHCEEVTENDPGVPIGRGEGGGVYFMAYPTGLPGAIRTLTWPVDELQVWGYVMSGANWQWQELSGGTATMIESQPGYLRVTARDEAALPASQKVEFKIVGNDASGSNVGEDSVVVFVPKTERITASSDKATNSPQIFVGEQPWPYNPAQPYPWNPDTYKALVIPYSSVGDANQQVADFEVDLLATVKPTTSTPEFFDEVWYQSAGPSSGTQDKDDTFHIKLQNPKLGNR